MFDNMTSGMESNRKLSAIVTELFVRETKLNVLIVSILNSYFEVPKTKNKCNTLFRHENSHKENSNK